MVWNKPQHDSDAIPTPQQPDVPASASPSSRPDRQAVLGPSITIKGSLSGEEDLLIEGHVEGEITFKKHAVTVGKPVVEGVSVLSQVVEAERGKKIIVFKKKRRKGYKRTKGHRQDYYRVRVEAIEA